MRSHYFAGVRGHNHCLSQKMTATNFRNNADCDQFLILHVFFFILEFEQPEFWIRKPIPELFQPPQNKHITILHKRR